MLYGRLDGARPEHALRLGPLAIEHSLSGLDATSFASGTATAVSAFDRVGAKSEVDAALGADFGNPVVTSAEATFNDQFMWVGGSGRLRFSLHLSGMASHGDVPCAAVVESGVDDAGVFLTLLLADGVDSALGSLVTAGDVSVTINVGPLEQINLNLDLFTEVSAGTFGRVVSEFQNTGHDDRAVGRNVTLTDNQGNVLGAAAARVPEPSTAVCWGRASLPLEF
jgi:hypothetical protein